MTVQRQIQQAQLPPAYPAYILRGHKAQIHALQFLRNNTRLLTGDAEGIIILWDLAIKRPKAVWRGHAGSIMGFGVWTDDTIISHGRDGKLNVWQLRLEDEDVLSKDMPVEEKTNGDWKQPWILHSLQVHALNFCAFAMCLSPEGQSLLVATPAANEGLTVIHELPSEKPKHLVPPAETGKTGMVMALRLLFLNGALHIVVGYESGLTSVQRLKAGSEHSWETISSCKPHTQPILSLDILPEVGVYFTSGADAVVSMASLGPTKEKEALKVNATKHAGQQGLTVRSDGRIFATAGWDGRMRVYSTKTLKELAVLKWHKEGCYSVALADVAGSDKLEMKHRVETSREKDESRSNGPRAETAISERPSMGITTVRQPREQKTAATHWLAAGSKDGKVSLWNIF